MRLIIKKGRILDLDTGNDSISDVLIVDGLITAVDENISTDFAANTTVVDASGLVVSAGFIDLHAHLREPGFTHKETIKTGAAAAARGGFTTICCMPNTNPALDSARMIESIVKIASHDSEINVLPIGCISRKREGRSLGSIAELKSAGAVAVSDDGSPVVDAELMRQALIVAKELGLPVIDHCEDPALVAGGVMNEGVVSAKLGYRGIPAAAEERMVARDIELARETGGHVHIAHLSTAGSVSLVRQAKDKNIRVTAEVTPHHLTLTEEEVLKTGTQAKVNPPLRTKRDINALIEGLIDGTIDAIATDHAPHAREDKSGTFEDSAFGISEFETAFGSLMNLVHQGKLELKTLISRLTVDPARILNLPGITGKLAPGEPADITLFDPDLEWTVDPGQFLSKGSNTPLTGVTLRGKVMMNIAQGHIVYQNSHVPVSKAV